MAVSTKGKEAVTHYQLLKTFGNHSHLDLKVNLSLISCSLETGRTHQIRVHMTHIGHPLLGDPVYGNSPKQAKKVWPSNIISFPRQALHAKKIQFIHPRSEELLIFESEYPNDFLLILEFLEGFKNPA